MSLLHAHCHLTAAYEAVSAAVTFDKQQRPESEILSLLDRALVATHDARAEITKARQEVYERGKEKDTEVVVPFPENHPKKIR